MEHNQNLQRQVGLLKAAPVVALARRIKGSVRPTPIASTQERKLKIICGSLLIGTSCIISTYASANPLTQILLHNSLQQLMPHHSNGKSVLPTVTSQAPRAVPITPPLPSEQQAPSAMITPINGTVSVILVNRTAASINYQVIGDTNERPLPGKSNFTLRALKTPVTITFRRQDGGLLKVTPQATAEPGILLVTYTETTNLGVDRTTMRIQRNGSVFLN